MGRVSGIVKQLDRIAERKSQHIARVTCLIRGKRDGSDRKRSNVKSSRGWHERDYEFRSLRDKESRCRVMVRPL